MVALMMLTACSTGSPGGGPPGGGPLDPSGIPKRFVPLLHQAGGRYCDVVTASALAAQDKVESNWDPRARSGVGAAGLAQFMPGTWASWGQDANGNGTNSPLDPADAIDAQARYMCSLTAQVVAAKAAGKVTGGVLTLAWAGYNAGLGSVLQYGGVPPFPQTQGYVRAVRAWMVKYSKAPPLPPRGGAGGWVNPLQGQHYTLSSGFGPRGAPCGGCSTWHFGQDLAVPVGTPVRAACSGTVLLSRGPMGGMGLATVIYCGNNIRTYYAHQSQTKVHPGQRVSAGQVIGYSGNTGASSGPHLHFEIHKPAPAGGNWYAGTPIDPIPFMTKHGAPL